MMPGTKQFVTCAFMITATKGREMSFQISIERGEKKELSKGLCSLEVLWLPKPHISQRKGRREDLKTKCVLIFKLFHISTHQL